MTNKFGFQEMKKVNGELLFILDDIEGMEVTYQGLNETDKKKPLAPAQTGYAEKLGKSVRIYKIVFNNKVEIKANGQTEAFIIENGNITWQ